MKKIEAAMAGTILNVLVQQGEEVSAGQTVMVLESMKMEIPVEASVEGKVASVTVSIGDFVNEGDTLLELE
ncbi:MULTISPECIES: biotin/lipoyl-containing protein [Bacillus]|uniref:biotin/lipoyl-containing protein n=1 Tax=Bacillus TaxID=1386 RepID=UPI000BB679E0|nr:MULTISPECIES: biotin/lipoyl-containing protein [Bacillus]